MLNEENIEVLDLDDNNQETQISENNLYEENKEVLDLDDNNQETSISENYLNVQNNNTNISLENNNNHNDSNPPLNNTENKKYYGYKYHVINYASICIISLVSLIIFLIGYNFTKEKTLLYTENSTANYQVCLKENDYYGDNCVNEDVQYVSAITDTIRADFNYNKVYEESQNKEYKYYIKSKLIIKTDDEAQKELLKQEKKLTKEEKVKVEKNVLSISSSIEIPFDKYNKYAAKYKSDYLLTNKSNLEISLVAKDKKNEEEVASINIPLTELTYNITKTEIKNKVGSYDVKSNSKINTLFIILIFISSIILIIAIIRLLKFLWKTRTKKSNYEKKLKQILNTYDRVIITLEDKNTIVNDTEVYTVKTFLELLDVRDTVDKPILYYKVNDIKTEFYVQDVNKTYKFIMKESDFEDKK